MPGYLNTVPALASRMDAFGGNIAWHEHFRTSAEQIQRKMQEMHSPLTYISIRGPAAMATDSRRAERLVGLGARAAGPVLDSLEVHTTGRTMLLRALLIIS